MDLDQKLVAGGVDQPANRPLRSRGVNVVVEC